MTTLLANVLGAWLAFATIALFVRTQKPKNTAITCAFCGTAVPMAAALEGGIGGANLAMRTHITSECEWHPIRMAQLEVRNAKDALGQIYRLAQPTQDDPLQQRPHVQLERIRDIARRLN